MSRIQLPWLCVLNALRHHGGRHPARRDGRLPGRLVLNALRHHGGRHEQVSALVRNLTECSTPCGITEGVTGSNHGVRDVEIEVLNALRHH